jgi:hypothetical protein
MWRDLVKNVRAEIGIHKALHAGYSELNIREDPDARAFVIRKSDFPSVKVRCQFSGERVINILFSYCRTENAEAKDWEELIDFHVDTLDRVQFEYKGECIDVTEARNVILRPVLDPSFIPPD